MSTTAGRDIDGDIDGGIDGRVVVVTGASRGIGRALATEFAQRGASVAMLARDEVALKEAAARLPADVLPVACDVTDQESVAAAFARVGERWGHVDSVVANAGTLGAIRRVHNISAEDWHRILDTNLTGAFLTARAAHPLLARSSRARLVFVSSVMARAPRHGVSAYTASKAGIEGLTRGVAADWAKDGIRVNAVSCGYIKAGIGSELERSPELLADVLSRIALGRQGSVAEVTGPVLFMAGDASGYITGHVLSVDGGYGLD
jgi:NAD(P)-dependent dehydrogenase (short-subunit alcohol dehydrogenase family)